MVLVLNLETPTSPKNTLNTSKPLKRSTWIANTTKTSWLCHIIRHLS